MYACSSWNSVVNILRRTLRVDAERVPSREKVGFLGSGSCWQHFILEVDNIDIDLTSFCFCLSNQGEARRKHLALLASRFTVKGTI